MAKDGRPAEASKPKRTSSAHVLPFLELGQEAFERLCLWLVRAEGYEQPEHYGLGGGDQGRDIVAFSDADAGRQRWYFQCKRVARITAPDLTREIDKVLALPLEDHQVPPRGIVFIVAAGVSARQRDAVFRYAGSVGLECAFWARTELDARVKGHPALLREFFHSAQADLGHAQASAPGSLAPAEEIDHALVRTYLQTLIQRLSSHRWPADSRLRGPSLQMDVHEIDIRAADTAGLSVSAERAGEFRRLVVLGGPGTGKTWFAARTAISSARRALEALSAGTGTEGLQLPVFARVAAVRDQSGESIREQVVLAALSDLGDLGDQPSVRALSAQLIGHPDLLAVLDSVDEAPGSEQLLAKIDLIQWKVVLTTRPSAWHGQVHIESQARDQAKVTLESLAYPRDVRRLIDAWVGSADPGASEALCQRIDGSRRLQAASQVPLLLAFFCILGPKEITEDLDATFDRVVNRLLHGVWRFGGKPEEGVSLDSLRDLLHQWAWDSTGFEPTSDGVSVWADDVHVHPDQLAALKSSDIEALSNVCAPAVPIDFDSQRLPRRFIHRAVQEHLVAASLAARSPVEVAAIVLANLWAPGEWQEVLPAIVRLHPGRVELCEVLLGMSPFKNVEPDRISELDLDGHLDEVFMALAKSAQPEDASDLLVRHVQYARLRMLDGPEGLEATMAWGVDPEADLLDLSGRLVPRTGSTIPSARKCPIRCLGLSALQLSSLRAILIRRMDELDGSYGSVVDALVECCVDEPDRIAQAVRFESAWDGEYGWRRDSLARAHRSLVGSSTDALRQMTVKAISADLAAGKTLSRRLVVGLSEWAEADPRGATRLITKWMKECASPYDAELLAGVAFDWPLGQAQRDILINKLVEMLRLSSNEKWFTEDRGPVEEQFVAMQICRVLTKAVRNEHQARLVASEMSRVITESSDLQTASAAAEALVSLEASFPSEPPRAEAIAARFRGGDFSLTLFPSLLELGHQLSPGDVYRGLSKCAEERLTTLVQELGPRPDHFWDDVLTRCLKDLESAEIPGEMTRPLSVVAALASEGHVSRSVASRSARQLDRFEDYSMEKFGDYYQFKKAGQIALDFATLDLEARSRIYALVAHRIVRESGIEEKKRLISILTGPCQREGKVPEDMLLALRLLREGSDDDQRLVCSRYEFLSGMTVDERHEFLELLSTHNVFIDVGDIRDIAGLPWLEDAQEHLWACVLARLDSGEGRFWQRVSVAERLVVWAQSTSQRALIEDRIDSLLSDLAWDEEALKSGSPFKEHWVDEHSELRLQGGQPRLPESGLKTGIGMFIVFLSKQNLSPRALQRAHNMLVRRAGEVDMLAGRAALLECAGVLGLSESASAQGRRLALNALGDAKSVDDCLRAQRAMLYYRPTSSSVAEISHWPCPPTHDFLRAVRRNSPLSDWNELLAQLLAADLL